MVSRDRLIAADATRDASVVESFSAIALGSVIDLSEQESVLETIRAIVSSP